MLDTDNEPIDIHVEIESLDAADRRDGARMYKYELDKEGKYKYMENDFVLFRYADILLMKKEAVLRGGIDQMPGIEDADIQVIKKRTFAYSADPIAAFDAAYPDAFTVLSTDLTDGILAERGREFTRENVRRRALIRLGQCETFQYVANKAETRRWFPIPYSVLQKAVIDPETGKKLWTQNPGY